MDGHHGSLSPPQKPLVRGISGIKIDMTGGDGQTRKMDLGKEAWLGESGFVHFVGEDEKPMVLLAEANAAEAALYEQWLTEENMYHVVVATDGAQALSFVVDAPSGTWDLLVTEKKLPRLSGVQLVERVWESGRSIPILLMSAENDISQPDQALSRGSHDFLIKPLTKTQLLLRVSQTLELHKNSARNAVYRQLMAENIVEMKRLQDMKDKEFEEVITKIEAPIASATSTLARILADPETTNNPQLREALESVLKKLVGDLYAPSLHRLQASLDPVALSLLGSYTQVSDSASESSSTVGSRKASLAISDQIAPKEWIELYGLGKWEFSCWDHLEDDLVLMAHAMIMVWSTSDFELDPLKLQTFIESVRANYRKNPYHSFVHAFDVMQTCFALLTSFGGVAEKWGLTTLEAVSVLIAALCHDLGHPGVNNKFLINTNDDLALTYNDKSVLENFHAAQAFVHLRNPLCNFLPKIPDAVYREIRQIIVSCILNTDMAVHFEHMSKLEQKVAGGKMDSRQAADRLFILECLVHAADLSNVAKDWNVSYRWSQAVSAEFFAQGDREMQSGLACEPFMDRTKSSVEKNTANFIKYVVQRYYGSIAAILAGNAGQHLLKQTADNLSRLERSIQ